MDVIEFCPFDADYMVREGSPLIVLWGKTGKGKTVMAIDKGFRHYFYVEPERDLSDKEKELLKKQILSLREMDKGIDGVEEIERKYLGEKRDMLRIYVSNPRDLQETRDELKGWKNVRDTYEYDISYYRRYLIDRGVVPMGISKMEGRKRGMDSGSVDVLFDIERTERSEGGHKWLKSMAIDIETSGSEIIMISLVSRGMKRVLTHGWKERGYKYVEKLKSEKDVLKRFADLVGEENPDVIFTYNGDAFDFSILKERAESLDVDLGLGREGERVSLIRRGREPAVRISGRVHIDLYRFVRNIMSSSLVSETYTLDMVAGEILGEGKKALEMKEMERMWREKKGIKRVSSYCKHDSDLTLKLGERLSGQIFELCRVTGQLPFDVTRMSYSQLVEWLLIRKAYEKGETALNRPKYGEIKRRREAHPYMGGYVMSPEPGIHKNIALFDFASLYPSTVITHNISPETLDRNGSEKNKVPESDHSFSSREKGFIPEIIETLLKKRMEIKERMKSLGRGTEKYRDLDNRQRALKILANASYGYYAYAGSRWYSRICAMSIAAFGRYYIKKVINFARENGYKVIYGDTDSLFLADSSMSESESFLKEVNRLLPETMNLEFDDIYKSGIFVLAKTGKTAKKRYALLGQDGEILIRGFELVRRDWCTAAKKTQERVLSAVLKDMDEEKAVNIIKETIEEVNKGKLPMEDVVIYTQLSKPIEEYDQIGPHVAAAKKYVSHGKSIKPGDLIGYVITKGEGSVSDRAEPYEYADNYDPKYYVNNQVLPAAMRVLHGLGIEQEEITGEEGGQKSLDTYMKKSIGKRLKDQWKKLHGS